MIPTNTRYSTYSSFIFLFFIVLLVSSCASNKKLSKREQRIQKIIGTSRTYVGVPYKWGGTTRRGMDCSGLLVRSFEVADISLPRTSAAQSKIGQGVKKKELRPGDLVFFAAGKKKRKITHVGLVTEVRSRKNEIIFIHASTKLGVVEANLNSRYYSKIFVKARRPEY